MVYIRPDARGECPGGFERLEWLDGDGRNLLFDVHQCFARDTARKGDTEVPNLDWKLSHALANGHIVRWGDYVCEEWGSGHGCYDSYGSISKPDEPTEMHVSRFDRGGWLGINAPLVTCPAPTATPTPTLAPTPSSCPPLILTSLGARPHAVSEENRPDRHGPLKVCHWWDMTPRFGSGHGRPCNDEHPEFCEGRPCEDPRGGEWRVNGTSDVEERGFQVKLCGDPGQEYTVTVCPLDPYLDGLGQTVRVQGNACDSRAWAF